MSASALKTPGEFSRPDSNVRVLFTARRNPDIL